MQRLFVLLRRSLSSPGSYGVAATPPNHGRQRLPVAVRVLLHSVGVLKGTPVAMYKDITAGWQYLGTGRGAAVVYNARNDDGARVHTDQRQELLRATQRVLLASTQQAHRRPHPGRRLTYLLASGVTRGRVRFPGASSRRLAAVLIGLFTDEGVVGAGASVRSRGRGLPMMEVPTPPNLEDLDVA